MNQDPFMSIVVAQELPYVAPSPMPQATPSQPRGIDWDLAHQISNAEHALRDRERALASALQAVEQAKRGLAQFPDSQHQHELVRAARFDAETAGDLCECARTALDEIRQAHERFAVDGRLDRQAALQAEGDASAWAAALEPLLGRASALGVELGRLYADTRAAVARVQSARSAARSLASELGLPVAHGGELDFYVELYRTCAALRDGFRRASGESEFSLLDWLRSV